MLYSTFQVRSLLCTIKGNIPLSLMKGIILRLVEYYQTLQLNVDSWNKVEGGSILIDNTDKLSYDFDALASVPKELNINDEMVKKLKELNKIN